MKILASEVESVRTDSPTWQSLYRTGWRSVSELCRRLELPADCGKEAVTGEFPLFAPDGFVRKIEKGNPHDPLLVQILPTADEDVQDPLFTVDPVGDGNARRSPGLIHKYCGRVLLIVTGTCAIHCRYCFRRHFPYEQSVLRQEHLDLAIQQIKSDASVEEVLLSGGDPLTLSDRKLDQIVRRLDAVEHLQRLRIHSRLPVVIPERVTESLIGLLSQSRLQSIVVIHANHPREIDDDLRDAMFRLSDAGVLLFNQSVLLKGVNDSAPTLADLSRSLIDCRVIPYYLHQLDRVQGAAHFEVPIAEGLRIHRELRLLLPGYAVPRYVQEREGEPSKTLLV